MKALFDRLLHGERVEEGGDIVWDTFFARSAGALYLQDLEKRHPGVLINRDPRKGILSLFGPEPKRRVVRLLSSSPSLGSCLPIRYSPSSTYFP